MSYAVSVGNSGFCSLQDQTIPFFRSSGSTILKNIVCKNDVTTSGSLTAKDCDLNIVKVSGSAFFETSKINDFSGTGRIELKGSTIQNCNTSGFLNIEKSSKIGDVTHSGNVRICNSEVKSILIKRCSNHFFEFFGYSQAPSLQTVELVGKDCKIGSITFEEGCQGEVVLKDGAKWIKM